MLHPEIKARKLLEDTRYNPGVNAIAGVIRETIQECAKAVCPYCRDGVPLLNGTDGQPFHPVNMDTGVGVTGFEQKCFAAAIHKISNEE